MKAACFIAKANTPSLLPLLFKGFRVYWTPIRGIPFGSVRVCGCFISTVRWKIEPFFPFSPWRDTRLRHFAGNPFGASRKKASTIFITQPLRKSQPFSMTQPFYYGRVSGIFGDATVNVCCFLSWSFREGEPTKCLMLCRCFTYNYLKSFLTIFCDLKIIRYFQ